MRVMLDTQIYLWVVSDDPSLSQEARKIITDADEVFVSSASIWEASIKVGLGKLEADIDELVEEIEAAGFEELPVRARHAALVRTLPDHHRDPFDRILIAQALSEPLRLLTTDEHMPKYTDLVIPVRKILGKR